jgi:pyridoxal phosphate-dependent aminotransferase EpsN
MSNVLAAIGVAQLGVIEERVRLRRAIFDRYRAALGELPGITFMPEAKYGRCTRWLTVLTVDPARFGADREQIRLKLECENIEARPVWKPMHMQPVFSEAKAIGGTVSEAFFRDGLCLPSGSQLTASQVDRICDIVRSCAR